MKNILNNRILLALLVCLLFITTKTTGQITLGCYGTCSTPIYAPLTSSDPFNFTNWDWTNQDRCNWITYPSGFNPQCINPPFHINTPLPNNVAVIRDMQDYTKPLQWELINAGFNTSRPFFILYNRQRALIRAFFYIPDPTTAYSHLAVTCKYSGSSNILGSFSLANGAGNGLDKYPNINNDMYVSVVENAGPGSWVCGDFPILFDPATPSKLNAKMELSIWGVDNYNITLKGTSIPASGNMVTSSSSFQQGTFDAAGTHARIKKLFDQGSTIASSIQSAANAISPTASKPVLEHKATLEKASTAGIGNFFTTIGKLNAVAGAVIGFFELFSGGAPNSTAPVKAVSYDIELSGTMEIQVGPLSSTGALKIPGTSGSGTNLYDCPMGMVNITNEPVFSRTYPFRRQPTENNYNVNPPIYYSGASAGYSGNYIKYRLDSEINIVMNKFKDYTLSDVKLAIVCRPQKVATFTTSTPPGDAYDINSPNIAELIVPYRGRYLQPNPVYNELMKGSYIIHKYSDSEVLYGTPYLEKNCLKGIIFEVPEKTDVFLSVIVSMTSPTINEPIYYKTNFKIKENPTFIGTSNSYTVGLNDFSGGLLYSEYYPVPVSLTFTNSNSSSHTAGNINLNNGFLGTTGFNAISVSPYPCNGNTTTSSPLAICSGNLRMGAEEETNERSDQALINDVTLYPNPSEGKILISNFHEDEELVSIIIFNNYGEKISEFDYQITGKNHIEIDLTNHLSGIYYAKIIGKRINTTKSISIIK